MNFVSRSVLDLQKIYEANTDSPHVSAQPVSPIINISHSYGTFVTIYWDTVNEQILMWFY